MTQAPPVLVIETSPAGVQMVTIRVRKGRRDDGLALLQRALPALREFNRRIRELGREGVHHADVGGEEGRGTA